MFFFFFFFSSSGCISFVFSNNQLLALLIFWIVCFCFTDLCSLLFCSSYFGFILFFIFYPLDARLFCVSIKRSKIAHQVLFWGFPGGSDGKESACNVEDPGSITGSGRSSGGGNCISLQYLAWRIPWTEEPGGLQSLGSQRVRHHWATNTFTLSAVFAEDHRF